jgi:SAM-dependent methyltransferase
VTSKWGIRYTGLPVHLTYDGSAIKWGSVPRLCRSLLRHREYINIDGWVFNYDYARIYLTEYRQWEKEYLPPKGVKGKTVLNVGAGAGESAKFFLDHGAREVIAVEPSPVALPYLWRNAEGHPITVIDRFFDVEMLTIPHDYMEMDIEGYEVELITSGALGWYGKDCSIEAHNRFIVNKLGEAGFIGEAAAGDDNLVKTLVKVMHRWRDDN